MCTSGEIRHASPPRGRAAFTLMELLLVISILAILAGLAIATLQGVRQDALRDRTTTVINQIQSKLLAKFESFETRQIPFNFNREFLNTGASLDPARPESDRVPNAGQRRHIYLRTLMEWTRSELPTQQEQLRSTIGTAVMPSGPPSIESQQPIIPVPPVFTIQADEMPNYWPNDPTRNWVEIYRRLMFSRSHSAFLQLNLFMLNSTDNLVDNSPLDNQFWQKENNNGYDGFAAVGVGNSLTPAQLAAGIVESAELLYAILHTTWDEQGTRGTHFLRETDIADVDDDGHPEIIDGRGFPLIFSVTIRNVAENGIAVDRNGDGNFDFRDMLLDPRIPAEPQDYQFHVSSFAFGLDTLPTHLRHLRYANFGQFNIR